MAGVYDGLLGGIANFDPDRRLVEEIGKLSSSPQRLERENRAFLRRAVGYCAEVGVRQFLDLGCGAPRDDSAFALVRGLGCRVVCVDVDPEVVAHTTLAVDGIDSAGVVEADCRRPEAVFGADAVRFGLDFGLPVAVLMVSVLQFVPDADDPAGVVAGYRSRLAPGSVVAVSHPSADGEPVLHAVAAMCPGRPTLRTRSEVAALLPAGRVVEPGLVPVPDWRPDDGPVGGAVSGPVGGARYPYYAAVVQC